jgi:PhoH-like ATPase
MDDGVRKTYVGDTSVFISDPGEGEEDGAIERLSRGNALVIPYTVLQELDRLKEGQSEKNRAAREVNRRLFRYRDGHSHEALRIGIPMEEGGVLIFADPPARSERWEGYDPENMDDGIILAAKRFTAKKDSRTWLVTKDISMSLRAAKLGVETMTFESERPKVKQGPYTGMVRIPIPDQEKGFLTELHRRHEVGIKELGQFTELPNLYPNQCCEIVTAAGSERAYAVFKNGGGNFLRHVPVPKTGGRGEKGIRARNAEQALAMELLADEKITLVSLSGKTGSGKTTLALAVGYELLRRRVFDSILVYRATVEAGQQLGFRPGDLEEKFAPFTQPIIDNMRVVLHQDGAAGWHNRLPLREEARHFKNLAEMMTPGADAPAALEISPFNFLRGRSLHRSFIIIDDAQNLTRKEVKLVLTRACESSRVVLTGDPKQVDLPDEDELTNGFSQVIERYKGKDRFGHLALPKSERGWLASTADDLL